MVDLIRQPKAVTSEFVPCSSPLVPMVLPRNPSVLVVDDEQDICQNLADILIDLGYEVDTALCGASAIEKIRSRSYDVALLDLKMPGMDGLTLFKSIRQERPDIVSFIVTAYANPEIAREALRAGVWQVLSKPINLSSLLTLVEHAVRQPVLMIIDDDVNLCKRLEEILHRRDYRVFTAHTDQEALRHLEDQQLDIVLIDLKVSPGDGRNILDAIHRHTADTRTVLITEHPSEQEVLFSSSITPDVVCQKPFDLMELMEIIDLLVHGPDRASREQ